MNAAAPNPAPPRASPDRRLSVAPMMGWTNRHFRRLARTLSRHTLLYTEMIPCQALLRGALPLRCDDAERPLALQLAGSDPESLAECARMAERTGFDEINLNVGCPSQAASSGRIGACLLAQPAQVADCVAAMCERVATPVTVKTRTGVDRCDSYRHLAGFVERVAAAGCRGFIVHARKAWLRGLSPKENRTRPPLQHGRVHRLKRDFPELEIVLNGGISCLEEAGAQLGLVDGIMIGRAAYHNSYLLAAADPAIFGARRTPPPRQEIFRAYRRYACRELRRGTRFQSLVQPLFGLLHGQPGSRRWRRLLSAGRRGTETETLEQAAMQLQDFAARRPCAMPE
ncbi:MAG: tRNA dihydrouridine(20/20a) synthase DusA [Gammaproteobacteria bacterium]|nr:tRNA dihydrouridine(20/20a) synthase DusA [Gammaproteobacteria bacterium]